MDNDFVANQQRLQDVLYRLQNQNRGGPELRTLGQKSKNPTLDDTLEEALRTEMKKNLAAQIEYEKKRK